MSFDKFTQLENSVNGYGQNVATYGIDDPYTRMVRLMCMELIRDLKAERDAPSQFPGLVVRIDHNGKHMSATISQEMLDAAVHPIETVAASMRGMIAEVLK